MPVVSSVASQEGDEEYAQRLKVERGLVDNRIIPKQCSFLHNGSRFTGEQRSGRTSYEVEVELKVLALLDTLLLRLWLKLFLLLPFPFSMWISQSRSCVDT